MEVIIHARRIISINGGGGKTAIGGLCAMCLPWANTQVRPHHFEKIPPAGGFLRRGEIGMVGAGACPRPRSKGDCHRAQDSWIFEL